MSSFRQYSPSRYLFLLGLWFIVELGTLLFWRTALVGYRGGSGLCYWLLYLCFRYWQRSAVLFSASHWFCNDVTTLHAATMPRTRRRYFARPLHTSCRTAVLALRGACLRTTCPQQPAPAAAAFHLQNTTFIAHAAPRTGALCDRCVSTTRLAPRADCWITRHARRQDWLRDLF